ncbi:MAG: LptE family protein [Bacteroidetes bacterium]|nr:LptE family protein [Bacteroidota bacterium]MBS1539841.1 LptE family protein [Bacteroidota bacterium]
MNARCYLRIISLAGLGMVLLFSGCLKYSLTGASTNAKTIQVDPFFNNTELGAANLGQTFTNRVKDYYQQNSSLRVVPTNGELQIEGTITTYSTTPVAPQASAGAGVNSTPNFAAQTRLTIAVKVSYVDNAEPKNNFKDRNFSFYADFDNTQDFYSVQETLEKKIFDQILIDIFNATIANW